MDAFSYSYLFGGLIFAAGMVYAARNGYLGLSGAGLRNVILSAVIFCFFMGLQAYLQYAPMSEAASQPYDGGASSVVGSKGKRGTPLDYSIVVLYFLVILVIGTWFARRQKTTRDFFFGGQRFAWWLIACSLVATTVGSYSFVKYSEIGYKYGLSSSQTYLNDWIWFPLLAFGWLPILYFSRVTSVPEYFGRRFGPDVRFWATLYLLTYLVLYIGVNLFTMGKVLNILLGWPVLASAALVAIVSAVYVTAGGQTSVIMTDLIQGVVLLTVGLLLLGLGIAHIGGFELFWSHLPRETRFAFPNFNEDRHFPSVGIFWQDGIANSAMFYFLNQGIIMRFMAAKSLDDSRKALAATVLVLMVVAACVVASGGWVARAFVNAGVLPESVKPAEAFFVVSEFLSRPGVFGLILAALTAALMSTVDSLITGVSAVAVNDVYRPYVRPAASERELLRVARITAITVTLFGIGLVPMFMTFPSIYEAHAAVTAAVTPPLVVALLFSVFWRRFTRTAAVCTLAGGMVAILVSLFVPAVITPFAHGVPAGDLGEGLLAGVKQHQFMRAFYGIVISAIIGVVVTFLSQAEAPEKQRGLVWGSISEALTFYKGSPGKETKPTRALATVRVDETLSEACGSGQLPGVRLSTALAKELNAGPGDLLYVTDTRWWTGGLYSAHTVVVEIAPGDASEIWMRGEPLNNIVTSGRRGLPVRVERLYGTPPGAAIPSGSHP